MICLLAQLLFLEWIELLLLFIIIEVLPFHFHHLNELWHNHGLFKILHRWAVLVPLCLDLLRLSDLLAVAFKSHTVYSQPVIECNIIVVDAILGVHDKKGQIRVDQGVPRLSQHVLDEFFVQISSRQLTFVKVLGTLKTCGINQSHWNVKYAFFDDTLPAVTR